MSQQWLLVTTLWVTTFLRRLLKSSMKTATHPGDDATSHEVAIDDTVLDAERSARRDAGRALHLGKDGDPLPKLASDAQRTISERTPASTLPEKVITDSVAAGNGTRSELEKAARDHHRCDPGVEAARTVINDAEATADSILAAKRCDRDRAIDAYNDASPTIEHHRFHGTHSWSRVLLIGVSILGIWRAYEADRNGALALLQNADLLDDGQIDAAVGEPIDDAGDSVKERSLVQTFVQNPAVAILVFELLLPAGVYKTRFRLIFSGCGCVVALLAPFVWASALADATAVPDIWAEAPNAVTEPPAAVGQTGLYDLVRMAMLLTTFAIFGCGLGVSEGILSLLECRDVPNPERSELQSIKEAAEQSVDPWVGLIKACEAHGAALNSEENVAAAVALLNYDACLKKITDADNEAKTVKAKVAEEQKELREKQYEELMRRQREERSTFINGFGPQSL